MFEKDAKVFIRSNTSCDTLISRKNSINLVIGSQVNFTVGYLVLSETSSITVENNSIFQITETLEVSAQIAINNKSRFISATPDFLDLKNDVTFNDSEVTGNITSHKRIEVSENSKVHGTIEVVSGAEASISKSLLDDLCIVNKGAVVLRNSTVKHITNSNLVNATGSNIMEVVNSGELVMTERSLTNKTVNSGTALLSKVLYAGAVHNSGRLTISGGLMVGEIVNDGELVVSNNSTVVEIANNKDALISDSFVAQGITNNGTLTASGDSYVEELVNHKNAAITGKATIKTVLNNGEVLATGGSHTSSIRNNGKANITQSSTVIEVIGAGSVFVSDNSRVELLTVASTAFISDGSTVLDLTNNGVINITRNSVVEALTNRGAVSISEGSTVKAALNEETTKTPSGITGTIDVSSNSVVETLENSGSVLVAGSTIKTSAVNNGTFNATDGSFVEFLENHGRASISGNSTVKEARNEEAMCISGGSRVVSVTNNKALNISSGSFADEVVNNKKVSIANDASVLLLVNNDVFNSSDASNIAKIANNNIVNITGGSAIRELTNNGSAFIYGSPHVEKIMNLKTLNVYGSPSAVEIANNGTAHVSEDLTVGTVRNSGNLSIKRSVEISSYAFFDPKRDSSFTCKSLSAGAKSKVYLGRTLDAPATFCGDVYVQESLLLSNTVEVSGEGWVHGPGTITSTGKIVFGVGTKLTDAVLVNTGEATVQNASSLAGTRIDNKGVLTITNAEEGSCTTTAERWNNSGTMLLEGVLSALANIELENTGTVQTSADSEATFSKILNKGALNIAPGGPFTVGILEFACVDGTLASGEGVKASVTSLVASKCSGLTIPWEMAITGGVSLSEGANVTVTGAATVGETISGNGAAYFNGTETTFSGSDFLIDGPDVYFSSGTVLLKNINLRCGSGSKLAFSGCTATLSRKTTIAGGGQVVFRNATLEKLDGWTSYINTSALVQNSTIHLEAFSTVTFGGSSDCVLEDSVIRIGYESYLTFYGRKACYFKGNMTCIEDGNIGFYETTLIAESATATVPTVIFQSSSVSAYNWSFMTWGFTINNSVLYGNYTMNNTIRGQISDSRFVGAVVDAAARDVELKGSVDLEDSAVTNNKDLLCTGCVLQDTKGSGSVLNNTHGLFLSDSSEIKVPAVNGFYMKANGGSSTVFSGDFSQDAGARTLLTDGSQLNFTGPHTRIQGEISGNGDVSALAGESALGFTLKAGSKFTCGGSTHACISEHTTTKAGSQITFQSENPLTLLAGLGIEGEAFLRSGAQCTSNTSSISCSASCTLHAADNAELEGCPVNVFGTAELEEGSSLALDRGAHVVVEPEGKMVVLRSATLAARDTGSAIENRGLVELHCSSSSGGIRNLNAISVLPCDAQEAAVLSRGTSEGTITVSAGAALEIRDGFESRGSLAGAGAVLLGDGAIVCGSVSAPTATVTGRTAICGPTTFAKVRPEKKGGSLCSSGSQNEEVRIGALEISASDMIAIDGLGSVVVVESLDVSSGGVLEIDQSRVVVPAGVSGNVTNAGLTGTGALVVEGALDMSGANVDTEVRCSEAGTLRVRADSAMPYGGTCNGTIELVGGSALALGNYTLHSFEASGSGSLYMRGKCFVYGSSATGSGVDVVLDDQSLVAIRDNLTVLGRMTAAGGALYDGTVVNRGRTVIEGGSCEFRPSKFENLGVAEWRNARETAGTYTVFSNSGLLSILSIAAAVATDENCVTLENAADGRTTVNTGSTELRYFPGSIANSGEIALEGGAMAVSVNFANNQGGLLNFTGGNIAVNRRALIDGVLIGSGTVANEDQYQLRLGTTTVLSPGRAVGDVGELRFVGAGGRSGYVFRGEYEVDIRGTASADLIRVEEALCGLSNFAMNVSFDEAFTPRVGDTFVVLEHVGSTGTIGGSVARVDYFGIDPLAVTHHKYDHNITIEVVGCPFGDRDRVKNCTHCQPGEYYDNATKRCAACERGTYSDAVDAEECTPCSVGSAVDVTGATSCELCEPGHFSNETGLETCRPCEM